MDRANIKVASTHPATRERVAFEPAGDKGVECRDNGVTSGRAGSGLCLNSRPSKESSRMTWSETLEALETRAGELIFDLGSRGDPEEALLRLNLCYKLDDVYPRIIEHERPRPKQLQGFERVETLKAVAE
jgi:hypothetical protein